MKQLFKKYGPLSRATGDTPKGPVAKAANLITA
jgi:hypothetical protein